MNNQGGAGKDPMAQLDAAMTETFQEIAQRGGGTSDAEVLREQPTRRRPRRQAAPEEEAPWFGGDQQQEERPRRQRRAAEEPDPAAVILEEAEAEEPSERARRRSGPQRDDRGRFLPSRDTDDQDEDDDEDDESDEETSTRAGGRRYAETEEADVEDDDVESEGRAQAEDEDDEERPARRGRRRFPRSVRTEIDRQVKAQVERVVAENERLREQQRTQQATDSQAIEFLLQAVGTQEQRAQLQATVNNTRLPIQQRNQAAAVLNRYLSNEQYARKYGQALTTMNRQEITRKRQAGIDSLSRYQIQLDPTIVHGEDESAMLMHVAEAAIKAFRESRRSNRDATRRRAATQDGVADERAVRNGRFGRDSLASSNGRRANGRVARTDPLRRAMGTSRGVAAGSSLPAPTDEVLQALRNNEITLADLGFR